ncbi:uncharacterized protein LOC124367755 isoform X1 [Homalodisca vitripennis]|uniref:uncharacterized protein LOC124367755 isoform X1 n=1 Tax=Homalodisca vitripennis TaxID=197043 RepID=UPI001EE9C048|nr:uncharacterized protein LOC124367755 isoform X1 [Homalodisca vitripennis]KAG8277906.1 hypothetical protein J6590_031953 [Homalodisca vitripennis]
MGVKKIPPSLYKLSLHSVSKMLLLQWEHTYNNNYAQYSKELKEKIGIIIPSTIYEQIFEHMIDSHAREIQNNVLTDCIPSVTCLINSIIIPNLRKLNLNCLRHMGTVKDEEIRYLENILLTELPALNNLVEISLQTSGTDFTLPTCSDEILEKIGSSCPRLRTLDISYNHTVTDRGLEYLVPSYGHEGCSELKKLSLFECSVTVEGVAMLLQGLPHLKFLGYRETGQSLLLLNRQASLSNSSLTLELAHLNNLGIISRTCKDIHKLKCGDRMVNAMLNHCPKLNGLKIRVNDSEVKLLLNINTVSILELVYNLGSPSSPGSNTIQYLQVCGPQFVSLSFVCDIFTVQFLKVISESCNNLKRLWIRSNRFICDQDLFNCDREKCTLTNLEVFFMRIGHLELQTCCIPRNVLSYVLHKSNVLQEIVLAMKNTLFCDSYVQELFGSIQTSRLTHAMILVPHKNVTISSLNLSMATVEALIGMCPNLEQLGNLLVWDVSLEEVQELRRQLKLSNSALVLLYKIMYS